MKNNICFIVVVFFASLCMGQKNVTWEDLSDVTFTDKYFPDYDTYYLQPSFGKNIKSLEGKEISVTGYFLNISPQDDLFILSKYPMATCFFCGMADPETVIELRFDEKPNFKTDDIVTITGVFSLNSSDVTHMNFILSKSKGRRTN